MTAINFDTIDDYINTFPEDVQGILEKIRQIIREESPDAVETISYGMPSFNLNGRYLVYFAGWKTHISLYPVSSDDETFQKELSPFLSGKGTAKFSLKNPIPYDLIKKIVRYRIKESRKEK